MEAEASSSNPKDIMRYGNDEKAPLEGVSDDDFSSDSDDDDPIPESAGQIKVALFRVLASGEIKRGEYSPQFDAHDDDEEGGQGNGGSNGDADIDHTTSFAKPKTLDPKSISTQTVTGIDPTDKPYAIFTFMYRGERKIHGIASSVLETGTANFDANSRATAEDGYFERPQGARYPRGQTEIITSGLCQPWSSQA
jgi:hypothetical protein